MTDLDLRPLSLGEILDRTFSLYRRHFALFLGITAFPQLLVLARNLAIVFLPAATGTAGQRVPSPGLAGLGIATVVLGGAAYLIAYNYSQGGSVFAVSELYLGRPTTIGTSLGRMRGNFWNLIGVSILNGMVIFAATILLIIPGVYMACRLITCVPAALLEDLGASESLSRSLELTRDNAGRAFVIYLLYFVLFLVAAFSFSFPFSFAAGLSAKDPAMSRIWLSLSEVGDFLATVLVTPFLTIATAVFSYDLRVRKEAFDLQLMMNPTGVVPSGPIGVPKTFS